MAARSNTIGVATATAIGVLALTVMSLGVATAANGGSIVLGHKNSATKTTTISDKKGTPLAIVGKKSIPPLTVNSSKEVKHLNAALLGGHGATALETSGSGVQVRVGNVPILFTPISTNVHSATLLMSTAKLSAGVYYLSGTAAGFATSGHTDCFLGTDADNDDAVQNELTTSEAVDLSLIAVVTVVSPTTYGEYCYGADTDMNLGGLIAIKVKHNVAGSLPPSSE